MQNSLARSINVSTGSGRVGGLESGAVSYKTRLVPLGAFAVLQGKVVRALAVEETLLF